MNTLLQEIKEHLLKNPQIAGDKKYGANFGKKFNL